MVSSFHTEFENKIAIGLQSWRVTHIERDIKCLYCAVWIRRGKDVAL